MLPEWETDISRQRGRKANLNQDPLNRTSYEEDFAKDKSFHDVEEPQALNKSFLPGISNSRQADSFRTINQNTNEKRHFHGNNRSVFDRPTITDENKILVIPSRSYNNSIERPAPRKHFDNSVSDEFDYREEYPEQNETLFTPAKFDQRQQRILPQHFSNRNNEDSLQKLVAKVSPHDKKNAQKAYGQFLLDQIKANASRRTIEREQRKEEDRQLLNQQGFLDGFGRSRDKFLEKYRSKLYQAPPIHRENNKTISPIAFDKVNNYERNYNLYPSSRGAMDHSFNQNQNPYSLRGNRNYMEEKENQQAVNRTMHPYYNNDLTCPSEENETEQAEDFDEKNVADIQKNKNKAVGFSKPIGNQKPKNHHKKGLEVPPIKGLNWKPSTDRLKTDADMLKTYISKMEYQKTLDKQVLEKQLQRAHDQKVREMEEIIEGLRISRERLMKELESNSITPKGKIAHQKLYKQSNSQPHSNRHNKHPQHTQGGSPIIIQPGDMNPKSNKSLLHNHSSKRTLLDNKLSSRRDLHEKPEIEHPGPQLNLHEQAQAELRKLKEELRQNNKRFQDQIYDVKNFLKKPSDYSKPFLKQPPRIKESDSKISLANESKLVPFQSSPTKSENESPDNHLPVNKTHGLESPETNNQNHFAHPKVIHNTLTLNSSETHQHAPERVTSNIDKEALDKLLNFAATIENSVKHQNLELRKEMNDLKQQIAKLLEGKGDRIEYDSIQSRLSQLKSDNKDSHSTDTKKISPVTQNSPIESKLSEPSTLQSNITKNKIEPGKVVGNSNTVSSTIEEKQKPQNVHNQKNIEPPKVDQKTVNSLHADVSKPRESSKVMQRNVGESLNSVPNNSESQKKNNTESHPQMEKSKILHPRDTSNFSLKKCVTGVKRSIRTGEEEFFKKV